MTSYTLQQLAEKIGADLIGDPHLEITGVNGLELATSCELSFLSNEHYLNSMRRSKAGAVLIGPEIRPAPRRNFLVHKEPAHAFNDLLSLFHTKEQGQTTYSGVHQSAIIHESAQIGSDVWIGPYAVIDRDVVVGNGTKIASHVSIGPGVQIGADCEIGSHVMIEAKAQIGDRVAIYSHASIGCTGFGFITDQKGRHERLTHVASVIIEDDVEIGPHSVIDRGHFNDTRVRRGTKIDGMVRIAHGVDVGEDNFIVGQSGIAGSSKTGKHVILAGQVGVKDHIELADGVICGARSGVMKSLTEAGKYAGEPATPVAELAPVMLAIRRLPHHLERIAKLEERIKQLEEEE